MQFASYQDAIFMSTGHNCLYANKFRFLFLLICGGKTRCPLIIYGHIKLTGFSDLYNIGIASTTWRFTHMYGNGKGLEFLVPPYIFEFEVV